MEKKRWNSVGGGNNHTKHHEGRKYFENQAYDKALEIFKELMEEGERARFYQGKVGAMGGLIALGFYGGKRDLALALKFFEYGAEANYDECEYAAALMYDYGIGTDRDPEKALKLYYDCNKVLKAVENSADAYEYGIHTKANIQRAAELRYELLLHHDDYHIRNYIRFTREYGIFKWPIIDKKPEAFLESVDAEIERNIKRWKKVHPNADITPDPDRMVVKHNFEGKYGLNTIEISILGKPGNTLYRYTHNSTKHGPDDVYIFSYLLAEHFELTEVDFKLYTLGIWCNERKNMIDKVSMKEVESYIKDLSKENPEHDQADIINENRRSLRSTLWRSCGKRAEVKGKHHTTVGRISLVIYPFEYDNNQFETEIGIEFGDGSFHSYRESEIISVRLL